MACPVKKRYQGIIYSVRSFEIPDHLHPGDRMSRSRRVLTIGGKH